MSDEVTTWGKISEDDLRAYLDNPDVIRKYLRYTLAVAVIEGDVDSQEEWDARSDMIDRIVACYETKEQ